MKYTVMGTGSFAQALAHAGAEAGLQMFSCGDGRDAELGIACGGANTVEELALEALENGMDAAVPGWIAGDFKRFERLHQQFAQREKKLILLFPDRYAPNVQDVQRVLQSNRLGRVGMLDDLHQWPRKGSALLPLAEALDTVLLWLGEPETLRGFRAGADDVDCATVSASFANGALLNLAAISSPHEEWKTVYEWSGSEGNLAYDSHEARSVRLHQEEELKQRFPMLGTHVCPLRAMMGDLPRLAAAHGYGASEADWKLASLIHNAFCKEGKEDA